MGPLITLRGPTMVDFSLSNLLDPQQCYKFIVMLLHAGGLQCPEGHPHEESYVHKKDRAPVLDYRCRTCGSCYNAFTGTVLSRTRYTVMQLVQFLRGIVQGESTARLAREAEVDRKWLLVRRHKLQALLEKGRPTVPLADRVVEVDEMYQNAGEKGQPHLDPEDPPRRRANKVRGHGTWDNDRPPVTGVVGRESGQLRLAVCHTSTRAELEPIVLDATCPATMVNTDEWQPYDHLPEANRGHATVCHSHYEWARDDDGDGIREVHCNTLEGIWTGLRNFLRRFRGVHKKYLGQYVAVFRWGYNSKAATATFLRALLGAFTPSAP